MGVGWCAGPVFFLFVILAICLGSVVAHAQATGLVASYSFEEGTGTTTSDASGNNNTGTLSNATWTTSGKSGKALSFNGTNSIVNIPDAASLNLTSAMTLEAWVYPTAADNVWRTVLMKEVAGELAYALYANEDVDVPAAYVRVGATSRRVGGAGALPLNAWTHLAATYTSGSLRIYVNGVLAATQAGTGSITSSTLPLRIGGNTIWGEYFAGRIDEVKLYNRALTRHGDRRGHGGRNDAGARRPFPRPRPARPSRARRSTSATRLPATPARPPSSPYVSTAARPATCR